MQLFVLRGDSPMFMKDISFFVFIIVLAACSESNSDSQSLGLSAPGAYEFKNAADNSTVSYSGQTARHVLIAELNDYISSGLQSDLDGSEFANGDEVVDRLNLFYSLTEEQYDLEVADSLLIDFTDDPQQQTLRDVSSSHKDLNGKIAGNDRVGQHKDWNNGDFAGIGNLGSTTPEDLVQTWFSELGDNAQDFIDGNIRTDVNGETITKIYITEDGRDLKQLIQKFLLGAVAFSQGADDYLDNDTTNKGLLTTNIASSNEYTTLEHQWDEGFGYFGAARNYLEYTDDEIAGKGGRAGWSEGYYDTDDNGVIDLEAEFNFGNSVNAAKRDRNTASLTNPTDFTKNAYEAFWRGRAIINQNIGSELTDEQMDALLEQRDIALEFWEKSIASTVVHYINDTRTDLGNFGTNEFSYDDLTKHWSEMKGFALGLQFNRFSPLTDTQFQALHNLMGDIPVLQDDVARAEYSADLLAARDILEAAYQFEREHVENW